MALFSRKLVGDRGSDERRTEIEGRDMQRRGGVGTLVMSAKCLPGRGAGVVETPRPEEG